MLHKHLQICSVREFISDLILLHVNFMFDIGHEQLYEWSAGSSLCRLCGSLYYIPQLPVASCFSSENRLAFRFITGTLLSLYIYNNVLDDGYQYTRSKISNTPQ